MSAHERSPQKTKPVGAGTVILCLLGAAWFLIGAVVALNSGKWPVFMPPQLDLIAVPISMLSEKWGAYVGGSVAALLGLALIALGIFVGRKGSHA